MPLKSEKTDEPASSGSEGRAPPAANGEQAKKKTKRQLVGFGRTKAGWARREPGEDSEALTGDTTTFCIPKATCSCYKARVETRLGREE